MEYQVSAELYYSDDNLENGTSCGLEMNARGFLFLTCHEDGPIVSNVEGNATCVFAPNEKGFVEAERLATALLEWVRHTKSINIHI